MPKENEVEKSKSVLEKPKSVLEKPKGSSPNVPARPSSQANNPPVLDPNNNNVCTRMKRNLPYFKTRIGILKIVSVVRTQIQIFHAETMLKSRWDKLNMPD